MSKTNAFGDPTPSPSAFMASHPVFRLEEFVAAHQAPERSTATIKALLRYHVSTGRLLNLRRGLYATNGPIDPWVLGTRLTDDAVIAYDGALSFYDLAGEEYGISILTERQVRPFTHDEVEYTPVHPPRALGDSWKSEVVEVEREGQTVRVTTVERTLVDMLDRIELLRDERLSRNTEQLRGCFLNPKLDADRMIAHAVNLKNQVVAARLGFFLEHMPYTSPSSLLALDELRPRSPAYFDRTLRDDEVGSFQSRWNLMVPKALWLRVRYRTPVGVEADGTPHQYRSPRRRPRSEDDLDDDDDSTIPIPAPR